MFDEHCLHITLLVALETSSQERYDTWDISYSAAIIKIKSNQNQYISSRNLKTRKKHLEDRRALRNLTLKTKQNTILIKIEELNTHAKMMIFLPDKETRICSV